jgi:arginase
MAAASTRSLSIIGAPTSAGAYGPGPGRTPGVFREHGLVTALRDSGIDVVDRGDGRTAPWQPDDDNPTARNADTVVAVATELADCMLELGTVAGSDLLREQQKAVRLLGSGQS